MTKHTTGRRAIAAGAGALLALATLSGCGWIGPVERFTDTATVVEAVTTIELVDPTGSVTITGDAEATEITVEREVAMRGERETRATHAVVGDTLELRGCGRNCTVDYAIEAPAGLEVRGATSNGAIELSNVGDVDVRTSNGRIDVDGAAGEVSAETSNGRVVGRDLRGSGVRVSTSNGGVELELAAPQDVTASTSNGSIELAVPDDSYRVITETSNGGIDVGVANDPDGRFTLDLRTANGSIEVTRG